MSEDPKGFDAGDYNMFRYCHNDPLDRVDPMGLTNESYSGYVNPFYTQQVHHQQMELTRESAERVLAARELAGLSTTYARAMLSMRDGLAMAHERATQKDDGLPKRFIIPERDRHPHERELKDGKRTYRWQAVTADGDHVNDYNMTNDERLLKGGAVAITGKRRMSSDAIMSDEVGYSGRLPGKLANFTGTRTNIIGNTVHAYGTDSRMTTEFLQVIQFQNGVVAGVSSTAIEQGHPQYVPQY